ncbi:LOW QUALITY PROTEIN: L-carnitine dehydratase/bile acid-inducible protein F [Brevundimonas abyssalis TAR-001]|uniref:L-carnitine dehydratase/bile acid-inducible protein F n=1 Tax=Brevundimonas abyssalis TAR-001 TaxID=1391729 RepID=A0A8E0KJE4_9CAUL|nr:LOW QUALITY PROTEIN: L-carnitine dehydratase/bile acid-inducible protein F [Brevundimonas abyssalis TAR-001]
MAPSAPLAGVRVLDLSRVLAGPWATQLLADLGAEVIKIERPGAGDDTRHWGPPFTTRTDGAPGDAAYFLCANRGKQSVALDIASPEGADLIRRMAVDADVLVENFKTGGLKKYGLDFDSLKAVNPKLVYCSITGFGQTGPRAARRAMTTSRPWAGCPSPASRTARRAPSPMKVGVAVADLFTGLYASNAILAALHAARASGQGRHIDIALFDVQAAMLANQATNYFVSGTAPPAWATPTPICRPISRSPAATGRVVIAVGNDGQFRALCQALGEPDLGTDDRFAANAGRVANRDQLGPILSALTAPLTMAALMQRLEQAGVPCGPVNTVDQVFAEPQAVARGLTVEQTRPDLNAPVRTVASPIRMDGAPLVSDRPPPALGEHTDAVLARYGKPDRA